MSERVNYTVCEDGIHVAQCVNMPIVVQADSFQDMKIKVSEMAKMYVDLLKEIVDNESYEYVEETYPRVEK